MVNQCEGLYFLPIRSAIPEKPLCMPQGVVEIKRICTDEEERARNLSISEEKFNLRRHR